MLNKTNLVILTYDAECIDKLLKYHPMSHNHSIHILADDRKDTNLIEKIKTSINKWNVEVVDITSTKTVFQYFKDTVGLSDKDIQVVQDYPPLIKLLMLPYYYEVKQLKKIFYSDDDVMIVKPLDNLYNSCELACRGDALDRSDKNHSFASQIFNSPEITDRIVYGKTIALQTGGIVLKMDNQLVQEIKRVIKDVLNNKDLVSYITAPLRPGVLRGRRWTFEQSLYSFLIYEYTKRTGLKLHKMTGKDMRIFTPSKKNVNELAKKTITKVPCILHYCCTSKKETREAIECIIKRSERYMGQYINYSKFT